MFAPLLTPVVKLTESCVLVADIESMLGAPGFCATNTEANDVVDTAKLFIAFVAKSEIVPLLSSSGVFKVIPLVSKSLNEVCTKYVNTSALLLLPDAYVAYRVVEPIVSERRGVPVTVTVSEVFNVKEIELPGMYVWFAGALTVEIVGRVRSITIVFADEIAEGPVVVVPITEFALS